MYYVYIYLLLSISTFLLSIDFNLDNFKDSVEFLIELEPDEQTRDSLEMLYSNKLVQANCALLASIMCLTVIILSKLK